MVFKNKKRQTDTRRERKREQGRQTERERIEGTFVMHVGSLGGFQNEFPTVSGILGLLGWGGVSMLRASWVEIMICMDCFSGSNLYADV